MLLCHGVEFVGDRNVKMMGLLYTYFSRCVVYRALDPEPKNTCRNILVVKTINFVWFLSLHKSQLDK